MGARSERVNVIDLDPSDLMQQSLSVGMYFEAIRVHEKNKVMGGMGSDPTTGSSQASGTGNTDWNVNISAIIEGIVDGVVAELDAVADYDIHSGSHVDAGFVTGQSIVATIVLKNDTGVLSVDHVIGDPATTGAQKPPTDAAIQTALGAGVSWIKLMDCTLNRTGDTTVTESQNNQIRPILGVTVSPTFGVFTG